MSKGKGQKGITIFLRVRPTKKPSGYFNFDRDAFFLKKARQWMAAYKIQQWFHAIRHNPKLKYGRK